MAPTFAISAAVVSAVVPSCRTSLWLLREERMLHLPESEPCLFGDYIPIHEHTFTHIHVTHAHTES